MRMLACYKASVGVDLNQVLRHFSGNLRERMTTG